MKFIREHQRFNPGALQLACQRLHFSAHVREVRVTDSWHYQATALDSNLDSAQDLSCVLQGIIRPIQAVQPAGVILVIQALRAKQQM